MTLLTLQDIVAPTDNVKFEIEVALEQQLGSQPLPFPGMDKSGAAVCTFFPKGSCIKGTACPYRHSLGDKAIVCKHWLRGLCKKGDECEFLHEYDLTKMPECFFYSRFNSCHNKECPFLHIDPDSKIKECPWYERGFCRHGPKCNNRHTRRVLCMNYLTGFCKDGSDCKKAHPTFDVPTAEQLQELKKGAVTCHHCQEVGHKIYTCPQLPEEEKQKLMSQAQQKYGAAANSVHFQYTGPRSEPRGRNPNTHGPRRPLEEVQCFKCGEKGHFANRCPKGHLAFLSNALSKNPPN